MRLRVPCFYTPLQTRTADDLEPWTLQASANQIPWSLSQAQPLDQQVPKAQQEVMMQHGSQEIPPQYFPWSAVPAQSAITPPDFMANIAASQSRLGDPTDSFVHDPHPLSDPLSDLDLDWASDLFVPGGAASFSSDSMQFSVPHSRRSIPDSRRDLNMQVSSHTRSTLPSGQDLEDLFDVFFERYHPLLPSIHQASFRKQYSQGLIDLNSDPLPWAIASVAAKSQTDQRRRQLCTAWLDKSISLFDANVGSLNHPQHTLQASVWIIFQCYVRAEMPDMWLWMGKACRLATLLGFDRIDATRGQSPFAPAFSNELELEERRQAVWALYMLDRFLSCLCGWPLAIDDRAFKVNFPRDDAEFQSGNLGGSSDPFSLDIPTPFGASTLQSGPETLRPGQIITRLTVLLGRIITHNNHMHPESDMASHAAEFTALQQSLSCFHIARTHSFDDNFAIPDADLNRVVWFEALLQMCTILLHHPTVTVAPGERGGEFSHASSISGIQVTSNSSNQSPGFMRCLQAMNNIVAMVCDISNRNIMSLLNPFLVPAYFLCSRFLAIGWHERQDPSFRRSLDLMLMLLDRCSRLWGPLAMKYRARVLHDLNEDSSWAQRARVGDGNYLGGKGHV